MLLMDSMKQTNVIWSNKCTLLVKLESKDISKIVIIFSASKDVSIKFADQCINILNDKERRNGLKGSKKIKNRESLFK